nr:MAG: hypothetical protein [Bacteriophage sp.]
MWIKTPAGKAMPCDPAPVYYKATPDGKDKVVTTRGEVVSCEIVPGANATDAGYRPHWATCPQAGTFRAPKYRKFDIKEPKARTIDTPRCTWKEGDCHE